VGGTVCRPQGSPAELEQRRLRAIELLRRDLPVHVVAERLGVDRRSVRRWKRAHRRQGRAGLRARPTPGRPPKLTVAHRRRLARLVVAGPEVAGYRTSLWTCRRLVDLIRRHFDVVYHPDHVGRLLRACGFSPIRGAHARHATARASRKRPSPRVFPWWSRTGRSSGCARSVSLRRTGSPMPSETSRRSGHGASCGRSPGAFARWPVRSPMAECSGPWTRSTSPPSFSRGANSRDWSC
jgi:transposase